MGFFKKIWNFRYSQEEFTSIRVRAVRYLVILLLVMACCTIVARAADGLTVSQAEAKTPSRSSLTHTVSLSGTFKAPPSTAVTAPSGMLVQRVAVQKGDEVSAGDLLFAFDPSELEDKIEDKQLEIKKQRLELDAMRQNAAYDREKDDVTSQRAQEDYDSAVRDAQKKVTEAQHALDEARTNQRIGQYTDRKNTSQGPKTATPTEPVEPDWQGLYALEVAVQKAERALDEAIIARDEALRDAQRDYDDALTPKADATLALAELAYRQLQKELRELQTALENGGEVYAPSGGIVTKIDAEIGKRTGNEGIAFIADSSSIVFEGRITKKQKQRVDAGDSIGIRLPGDDKATAYKVGAVEPIEDSEDYLVTAALSEGAGTPDVGATAEVKRRTPVYEMCVPLSALYQENQNYYVFVAEAEETSLGTEYVARRVDVQLHDSNETLAAVSGGLTSESQVITQSAKPLRDGDRVRLE